MEKHRHHIQRLELLLRMLDNETIEPEAVESIMEDVEYYVEHHNDSDFHENELIYDDICFDDVSLNAVVGGVDAASDLTVSH